MRHDRYDSPLCGRYASRGMQELFSDDFLKRGWRRMWFELARAESDLGAPVTADQVRELGDHLDDPIDYELAAEIEKKKRHDVLTHIEVWGRQCPIAAPIIHLGATSCDITDNIELVQMRQGLRYLAVGLARVIDRLARFAQQHRTLATLGFTHYQAASLTTVGKRACMWAQNFVMDLRYLEWVLESLKFRGIKGATGTQDSFLMLLDGDHDKVRRLDRGITLAFGFSEPFTITGQTYPRKQDTWIMHALSGISASVHKMATDLRLLAHDKEIEEPFEANQGGSSAMAFKRNPMRNERACSLSRLTIAFDLMAQLTEALQWLERSLDDSAGRRIYTAESFLAADAVLRIMQNVSEGLVVYAAKIASNIREELPFMATERFIVAMVRQGANRQECHERIRVLSREAAYVVKAEGGNNDLIERIRRDPYFVPIHADLDAMLDPQAFIGRAPQLVDEFLAQEVEPVRAKYRDDLAGSAELKV